MDAQTQTTEMYVKALEWLHVRRKPLLIGAAAAAVIALVWAIWSWHNGQDEADANAQFFSTPVSGARGPVASSPAPLLELAREYPGTAAGEHARLLGAEELFTQGKYPEASQQFSDFINSYPESALIPQAKVGLAACLEAEGKSAQAIEEYHKLILTYPTEMNILSPAKLTLARLFDEGNQPQQALSYYSELARLLSQNPYDPWAAEARERAQLLLSKHPELMKAMNNAAPSAAPSGFNLGAPGSAPAATPSPGATPAPGPAPSPAPQPAPTSAPSGQQAPKLLTIPGGSSNSTGKP
jgi:TolA-binding protein